MPLSRKSLAAARLLDAPQYAPPDLSFTPLSAQHAAADSRRRRRWLIPAASSDHRCRDFACANATALFISIWSSVIVSSNTSLDDASSSCWMIVGVSARIDMLKGEIQCSASTEPIGLRTIGSELLRLNYS